MAIINANVRGIKITLKKYNIIAVKNRMNKKLAEFLIVFSAVTVNVFFVKYNKTEAKCFYKDLCSLIGRIVGFFSTIIYIEYLFIFR